MSILEAKVGIVEIFIDLPQKEFWSKPLPSLNPQEFQFN